MINELLYSKTLFFLVKMSKFLLQFSGMYENDYSSSHVLKEGVKIYSWS